MQHAAQLLMEQMAAGPRRRTSLCESGHTCVSALSRCVTAAQTPNATSGAPPGAAPAAAAAASARKSAPGTAWLQKLMRS